MNSLQIAQKYVRLQGYGADLQFLKKWKGSDVFSIPNPQGIDFGRPQVVVVHTNGNCEILDYADIVKP